MVKVDTTAPVCTISSVSDDTTENQVYYVGASRLVWYNPTTAASFNMVVTNTDTNPAAVNFPAVGANFTGLGNDAATPWQSSQAATPGYSFNTSATVSASQTITCYDTGNLTGTVNFTVRPDSTVPSGGSLSYTDSLTTTSVTVTIDDGSDADAGMTDSSLSGKATVQLQRDVATLSGGSCSGWSGSWTDIGTQNVNDASEVDATIASGNCYKYRLVTYDNVNNQTIYTSATELKVDTTAPSCAISALNENPAGNYLYITASTVFYNSGGTGSWQVVTGASDAQSGMAYVQHPALTGITGSGPDSGSPYQSDQASTPGYDFGAGSTYSAATSVTCWNNQGLSATSNYTVTRDVAGPTYTTLTVNDGTGADIDYQSSTTTMDANWAFTGLADALSGVQRYDYRIVQKAGTCVDYNGACGESDDTVVQTWTSNGTATSVTASSLSLTDGQTYAVQVRAVDQVENYSTIKASDGVLIDNTAPTCTMSSISEAPSNETQHYSSSVDGLYYRSTVAGGFIVNVSLTDTNASHVAFPSITGMTGTGNDSSSPYQSYGASTPGYSYSAGTNSTGTGTVTCVDLANNTATDTFDHRVDDQAPSGGSVSYTNGVITVTSLTVNFSQGVDNLTGSGITTGAVTNPLVLDRDEATYSGGSCGAWGGYAQVATPAVGATSYGDTLTDGKCYRYRLTVKDNVSNSVTYTTTDVVKVDTTAPVCTISSVSDDGSQSQVYYDTVTYSPSKVVFYQNASAGAAFNLVVSLTDTNESHVAFPALGAGFTGTGNDTATPYQSSQAATAGYSFDNTAVVDNTNNTVTCYDTGNLSATADFTLKHDNTAPSGGSVTYTDSIINTTTVVVSYGAGSDADSGLTDGVHAGETPAMGTVQVQRDSATYSNGVCGAFSGTWSDVGAQTVAGTTYSDTTVASGNCYIYRLRVLDNVSNQSIYTSPNIVKVDTTAPSCDVAAVSESPSSAYLYINPGTTVYYNPAAGAGDTFDVGVSSTDAESGINRVNFPDLTGVDTGGDDTTSPYSASAVLAYNVSGGSAGGTVVPTCYNGYGASAASATTVTVTRDAAGPTISYVSDSTGTDVDVLTNSAALPVNYSATDALAGIRGYIVRLYDTITLTYVHTETETTATTVTISPSSALVEGRTYVFEVTAYDNVNNSSTLSSDGFIYDTSPPVVRLTDRDNFATLLAHDAAFEDWVTGGTNETVGFTYQDATNGTVNVAWYEDTNDNCLADDGNSWVNILTASATVGDTTQRNYSYSWDMNPVIPLPGKADVIIRATGTDGAGLQNNITYNSGNNTAYRCNAGGLGVSLNYNLPPQVVISTVSGNGTSPVSASWDFGTAGTDQSKSKWVTNDNTPTITWLYTDPVPTTSQSQYLVEVYSKSAYLAACAVGSSPATVSASITSGITAGVVASGATGSWTPGSALTDGVYLVKVGVWDGDGLESENQCGSSSTYVDGLIVDTVAPAAPTILAWENSGKTTPIANASWVSQSTIYVEASYPAGEDEGETEARIDCNYLDPNGELLAQNPMLHGMDYEMYRAADGSYEEAGRRWDNQVQSCDHAPAGGTYALSFSNVFTDGQWELGVEITDAAGNMSVTSFSYWLDTAAPNPPTLIYEDKLAVDGVDDDSAENTLWQARWTAGSDSGSGLSHYYLEECSLTDRSVSNFSAACAGGAVRVLSGSVSNGTTSPPVDYSVQLTEAARTLTSGTRYLYRVRAYDNAGKVSTATGWSDGGNSGLSGSVYMDGIVFEGIDEKPYVSYASAGSAGCPVSNNQGSIQFDLIDFPAPTSAAPATTTDNIVSPSATDVPNAAVRTLQWYVRDPNWPAGEWDTCTSYVNYSNDTTYLTPSGSAVLPTYFANNWNIPFSKAICGGFTGAHTLTDGTYLVQLVATDGTNNTNTVSTAYSEADVPKCVFDDKPPVTVLRARTGTGYRLATAEASETAGTLTMSYYFNASDYADAGNTYDVVVDALVFDPASNDPTLSNWENDFDSASPGVGLGPGGSGSASQCDNATSAVTVFPSGSYPGSGTAYLAYRVTDSQGAVGSWINIHGGSFPGTKYCSNVTSLPALSSDVDWLNTEVNVGDSPTNALWVSFSVALSDGAKLEVAARAVDRTGVNAEPAANDSLSGLRDSNFLDQVWVDITPPKARLVLESALLPSVLSLSALGATDYASGYYTPYGVTFDLDGAETYFSGTSCTASFDPRPEDSYHCTGTGAGQESGLAGYVVSWIRYQPPSAISTYFSGLISGSQGIYNTGTVSMSDSVDYLDDFLSPALGTAKWFPAATTTTISFDACTSDSCPGGQGDAQGRTYCVLARAVDWAGNVQSLSNYLGLGDHSTAPTNLTGNFARTGPDYSWREHCVTLGAPGVVVDNLAISVDGLWTAEIDDCASAGNNCAYSVERIGPRQRGILAQSWSVSRFKGGSPGF